MFCAANMDEANTPWPAGVGCPPDVMSSTRAPAEPAHPGPISLPDLPSELISHILSYLPPSDLVSLSLTNHVLRAHSLADHLWQSLVQSNVPGIRLTTPSPCASFRELYIAHDPRWFLTKYKVWFCDRDLTGKLVIIRYDERRGVIEGYQLLANRPIASSSTNTQSLSEQELVIHEFEPELKLHLDKPVLQMRADSLENAIRVTTGRSPAPSIKTPSSAVPLPSRLSPAVDHASTGVPTPVHVNRFSAETPMPLDNRFTDNMFNTFMLARSLPDSLASERQLLPFPYGNTWPPPSLPADTRVSAGDLIGPEDRPTTRHEINERSFRIRSWIEMRPAGLRGVSMGWIGPSLLGENDWPSNNAVFGQASRAWLSNYIPGMHPSMSTHIGDQITTYSTLDPELYTPTISQPWKGIWVGDYSAHGCEFLLITQNHPAPFDEAAFDATRSEDESAADFEKRKTDARRYRGRLEAVKLTGDPNVPRGECTFLAEDLGEQGFVTTVDEEPFRGARVVRSKGHVAQTGFVNGKSAKLRMMTLKARY